MHIVYVCPTPQCKHFHYVNSKIIFLCYMICFLLAVHFQLKIYTVTLLVSIQLHFLCHQNKKKYSCSKNNLVMHPKICVYMYLLSLFKPIQSMSCRYSRTDHAILQRGCANLKLQIQGRLNPSNRYQNTDDFFSSYVYRVDKEVFKKTNKSRCSE